MPNWLSRMFTIPRKERERIAQIPGIHSIVSAVKSIVVASAQSIVDQHVADPEQAERIKAAIEMDADHAVPTPPETGGAAAQAIEGLVGFGVESALHQRPAAPPPTEGPPQ